MPQKLIPRLLLPLLLAATAPAATVTFTQDVAPIIFSHCSACHRPGEAAPFTLMNYADVKKHGTLIAAVTAARIMPPWKAEPASYPYRDSRRLTDDDLKTLQTWIKQGMPEGDPAKLPALPKFTEGWQLGTPDLIVKMDKAFPVPAEGSDTTVTCASRSICLTINGYGRSNCARLRARWFTTFSISPIPPGTPKALKPNRMPAAHPWLA